LGVSARTIRRDMERLRDLGYPVHSTRGLAGYRLGAGAALPPLLLDDDEAVAVAVGLRTAAAGVSGIEEASLGALAKLEQLLPTRLRRRVNAVQVSTLPMPGDGPGPRVDPAVLVVLAAACRDRERLRLAYRDHQGSVSRRAVEPYRLVSWGRRWYLVTWDLDGEGWRILRVDRVEPATVTPTGQRFAPRELPEGGDLAAYVSRRVSAAAWRYHASVRVHAPAGQIRRQVPAAAGVVEAVDAGTCLLHTGADTLQTLAVYLGMLGADFQVDAPPELVAHLRDLAGRYRRATVRDETESGP
ncbi:MAG TPA: YafY family protein, partial [Actinomycetota bacterium]|nr:YafY family protein [Actinomycetota bacterium]